MKKLTIGLTALLSSYMTNSLGALPGNSYNTNVCVPPATCSHCTFGLTGLYWRPSIDQIDYAITYPRGGVTDLSPFVNGSYQSVDHNNDWGYKASVGYLFSCTANDIQLTYTHWDNDQHDRTDTQGFTFSSLDPTDFLVSFDFSLAGAPVLLTLAEPVSFVRVGTVLSGFIPFEVALGPDDLNTLSAHSEIKNHTWDVDFGQGINVGCSFKMRWFGGLRYSRLEHDLDTVYDYSAATTLALEPTLIPIAFTAIALEIISPTTATVAVAPFFDVAVSLHDIIRQKSQFDGIGPRFGFDASYYLGGGFGVVGNLATALIVGQHEANLSERIEVAGTATLDPIAGGSLASIVGTPLLVALTSLEPSLTTSAPATYLSVTYNEETRVVPNIDAKLGLNWTYQFCNCNRSRLTVEAGYMVSYYFNAIDRLSVADIEAPSLHTREKIDLGFDGPYVGLQLQL